MPDILPVDVGMACGVMDRWRAAVLLVANGIIRMAK